MIEKNLLPLYEANIYTLDILNFNKNLSNKDYKELKKFIINNFINSFINKKDVNVLNESIEITNNLNLVMKNKSLIHDLNACFVLGTLALNYYRTENEKLKSFLKEVLSSLLGTINNIELNEIDKDLNFYFVLYLKKFSFENNISLGFLTKDEKNIRLNYESFYVFINLKDVIKEEDIEFFNENFNNLFKEKIDGIDCLASPMGIESVSSRFIKSINDHYRKRREKDLPIDDKEKFIFNILLRIRLLGIKGHRKGDMINEVNRIYSLFEEIMLNDMENFFLDSIDKIGNKILKKLRTQYVSIEDFYSRTKIINGKDDIFVQNIFITNVIDYLISNNNLEEDFIKHLTEFYFLNNFKKIVDVYTMDDPFTQKLIFDFENEENHNLNVFFNHLLKLYENNLTKKQLNYIVEEMVANSKDLNEYGEELLIYQEPEWIIKNKNSKKMKKIAMKKTIEDTFN